MAASTAFLDLEPTGLSATHVRTLLDRHKRAVQPRLAMLWNYYRNPMRQIPTSGAGGYRLAQERGLPVRLLGLAGRSAGLSADSARKEVVVENDIAWRVHAMVDFMFGQRVRISSTASDPARRRVIDRVLEAVWEDSGGLTLMQDMALMGNVYGSVDLIVRATGSAPGSAAGSEEGEQAVIAAARNSVRIEMIEPTRGIAALSPDDYRQITGYVITSTREDLSAEPETGSRRFSNWRRAVLGVLATGADAESPVLPGTHTTITEVIGPGERRVYETGADGETRLIDAGASLVDPGRRAAQPPVVHVQNLSQPFVYEGLSEVEPLIPLQDELNTRLSDRASRVTMQSFRMYLAKGIDGADKLPVSPGTVWTTENTSASITPFGGDSDAPSEAEHIEQVREAMDKISGVPPLASGVVRAKIGNLSSENALKVTLMGLLSKTARKRVSYGRGIGEASRLVLEALDLLGIVRTTPQERDVRVDWPDPLPRDERSSLTSALQKLELGVPREQVLSELGYSVIDPGIE